MPRVRAEGAAFGVWVSFSQRSSGLCSFRLLDKEAFYKQNESEQIHPDFHRDQCYPAPCPQSKNKDERLVSRMLTVAALTLNFILSKKAPSRYE